MTPNLSKLDGENCSVSNFKLIGYVHNLFPGGKHFLYFLGISRIYCVLHKSTYAFLGGAVSHVIRMRSDPKMFWIHARRVVAMMKNMFPFRDFSIVESIRKSMCVFKSVWLKYSISPITQPSDPLPASIVGGFLNIRPKPLKPEGACNFPASEPKTLQATKSKFVAGFFLVVFEIFTALEAFEIKFLHSKKLGFMVMRAKNGSRLSPLESAWFYIKPDFAV